MELEFLKQLPPSAADVALERVRQLLVASDEIRTALEASGGADAIETVHWFNPLDNRDGPVCMVGLQPAAPDRDGPYGFSQQTLAVLVRLRFKYLGNWNAAHSGSAIPLVFSSTTGAPVNAVPVPRTVASWSAAVLRALRADQHLLIQLDGSQVAMADGVEYGPHAFGAEPEAAGEDGSVLWYNADTVATYTLMTDFRDGRLWNLRSNA